MELEEVAIAAKKVVAIATEKDRSITRHCQVCLKGAFAADRPVVVPVARRSCEYHEEALGVTGCLTAAVKRTIPAVVELMELVLAEQPGPRVEKVAAAELPDAATVAIGLTVAVIMPLALVVLRRYCFGKSSYASLELKYLA